MAYNVYERYTQLMRTSSLDLWRRLRVLLAEQGIDPHDSVLVNLFPDGGNDEFGQIISQEDQVYCFSLAYDREQKDGAEHAVIRNWTEITDGWQRRSLAIETADAFIWRVPRRPTDLSL
ncbi:hypothetical protein [Micromonospora sp. URMC 103]|uniref:hypothetical protein n=1 Tax=Micromonospora sp. URMC 103 TaxID=3423406 RepID=UPI003F1A92D2